MRADDIMKTFLRTLTLTFIPVVLAMPSALASPLLWTIGSATLNDGGTASGSFVYDADTDTFSSINLVTTAGSTLSGSVFQNRYFTNASHLVFLDSASLNLTGVSYLDLYIQTPLTNAGGTVNISPAFEGKCADAGCNSSLSRIFNEGATFVASAVGGPETQTPEPASLSLMALGAAALWMRKQHARG